jgi:hypothetical protein
MISNWYITADRSIRKIGDCEFTLLEINHLHEIWRLARAAPLACRRQLKPGIWKSTCKMLPNLMNLTIS